MTLAAELPWLWGSLFALALATGAAIWGMLPRYSYDGTLTEASSSARFESFVLWSLLLSIVLMTIAMGVRWDRIGHGPFVSLFELLMSQIWSLSIFYVVIYWRAPSLRGTSVIIFPALWVLGSWVLILDPTASFYPATYYNNWKWAHVLFGKVFLGAALFGLGLAGIILLRQTRAAKLFSKMPSSAVLDHIAWRFMMLALIFDSLMLIAGAVWAQDAWGRYWQWDELETSSFLNWLYLGAIIHLRMTYRIPLQVGAWLVIGVFVFAFLTYFGAPYFSPSAHKGVV